MPQGPCIEVLMLDAPDTASSPFPPVIQGPSGGIGPGSCPPVALGLLLLGSACVGPEALPEDSGLDITADCVEDADGFGPISQTGTSISTVFQVDWGIAQEAPVHLEIWSADDLVRSPSLVPGQPTTLFGLGFPPLTQLSWRLVLEEESGPRCSPSANWVTGSTDPELPEVGSTFAAESASRPLTLVPLQTPDSTFIALLNRGGAPLWSSRTIWRPFRAAFSLAQDGIWAAAFAYSTEEDAVLSRIGLDGVAQQEVHFPAGHTDHIELPDGSLAMLGWEIRDFDDGSRHLLGDTLLLAPPDGEPVVIWNVFDHFEPDLTTQWDTDFWQADEGVEDWSHANGLSYDAEQDAFYISLGKLGMVTRVDRATGSPTWTLGGEGADLRLDAGIIDLPHSVHRLEDGRILVFDRHFGTCSTVDWIEIDEEAMRADLSASYVSPDCLKVVYLGEAAATSTGGTLISWSSAGRIEELDPDLQSLGTLDLPAGFIFGFVQPLSSAYGDP